ncbi:sugar-binding domain-containing protein [uncultured Propionibacterium sp.]|uniref:glycoside hydrolase family 2 protein n=1 Tax=uncultured Propionibacterium sp. TaxID=218066 RepID=UPI00292CF286|nr:sugar-binding domain-containing protein [uncultured Propionibacterium sp.]
MRNDPAGLAARWRPSRQDGSYPRPTLVRANWAPLDGPAGFAFDDEGAGLRERWWESSEHFGLTIALPFPPESRASGIADERAHPVVWYRIGLTPAQLAAAGHGPGRRLLLHFGGVDYHSIIWVDGIEAGSHEGGQSPFALDITDALRGDGPHAIVVRAWDDPYDRSQPRGKQTWQDEPAGIWYRRSTGIWRPVWIESVPSVRVRRILWRTPADEEAVTAVVELNRRPRRPVALRMGLAHRGRPLASATTITRERTTAVRIETPGSSGLRWSPERPELIDAVVIAGEDRVSSYTGLREIGSTPRALTLDGRPVYLRQVLEQCYWPESLYSAPGAGALREEAELVRRLGFNGMRIHQQSADPRLLHWADRLGLLVFGEIGAAHEFGSEAVRRLRREWVQVVRANQGHPSIVCWVPVNESWGFVDIPRRPEQARAAAALARLTRDIDPSRPALSNDGWHHVDSELLTVHDYDANPARMRLRYRGRQMERWLAPGALGPARNFVVVGADQPTDVPVLLDEFGGIGFCPDARNRGWGYSTVHTRGRFVHRIDELVTAVRTSDRLGGYCWTQLTDTGQETNGLCDGGRRPKAPVQELAAVFGRAPEAYGGAPGARSPGADGGAP